MKDEISDPAENLERLQESPLCRLYSLLWEKTTHDDESCAILIPHTVVFEHQEPVAWYFTSSESGRVLRKHRKHVTKAAILAQMIPPPRARPALDIVAILIYLSPDNIDNNRKNTGYLPKDALVLNHLSATELRNLMIQHQQLPDFAIVQQFVSPSTEGNHLIRTTWSSTRASKIKHEVCLNVHPLCGPGSSHHQGSKTIPTVDRVMTYEGADFLSRRQEIHMEDSLSNDLISTFQNPSSFAGPSQLPNLDQRLHSRNKVVLNHVNSNIRKNIAEAHFYYKIGQDQRLYFIFAGYIAVKKYINTPVYRMVSSSHAHAHRPVSSPSLGVCPNCKEAKLNVKEDFQVTYKAIIDGHSSASIPFSPQDESSSMSNALQRMQKRRHSSKSSTSIIQEEVSIAPKIQKLRDLIATKAEKEITIGVASTFLDRIKKRQLIHQARRRNIFHVTPVAQAIPPLLRDLEKNSVYNKFNELRQDPVFLYKTVKVCETCSQMISDKVSSHVFNKMKSNAELVPKGRPSRRCQSAKSYKPNISSIFEITPAAVSLNSAKSLSRVKSAHTSHRPTQPFLHKHHTTALPTGDSNVKKKKGTKAPEWPVSAHVISSQVKRKKEAKAPQRPVSAHIMNRNRPASVYAPRRRRIHSARGTEKKKGLAVAKFSQSVNRPCSLYEILRTFLDRLKRYYPDQTTCQMIVQAHVGQEKMTSTTVSTQLLDGIFVQKEDEHLLTSFEWKTLGQYLSPREDPELIDLVEFDSILHTLDQRQHQRLAVTTAKDQHVTAPGYEKTMKMNNGSMYSIRAVSIPDPATDTYGIYFQAYGTSDDPHHVALELFLSIDGVMHYLESVEEEAKANALHDQTALLSYLTSRLVIKSGDLSL